MEELIKKYKLSPHPEGGYYREVYRSAQTVNSPINDQERHAVTQIYFLLTQGQFSRFHRVIHDEIWHFYEGKALTLIQYDGKKIQKQTIGPGQEYTAVVPGGTWQAAESTGAYSLVGCTVAPGFDFADFSFLEDQGEQLKKDYPQFQKFI